MPSDPNTTKQPPHIYTPLVHPLPAIPGAQITRCSRHERRFMHGTNTYAKLEVKVVHRKENEPVKTDEASGDT